MSNKKWYENIPKKGVLVSVPCGQLENIIIRIMSFRVDEDWIYFTDDNDIEWRDSLNNIEINPLNTQEWWDFAPWQPMETAPRDEDILVVFDDGNFTQIMFESGTDPAQPRCKKWLPLPKVNHE
jgi:hypothetical protein